MKYVFLDPCHCGHRYQDHFLDGDGQITIGDSYDGQCYLCYTIGNNQCKKFKLNNLEYILNKAEERKLL